jgi:hypothetical protein
MLFGPNGCTEHILVPLGFELSLLLELVKFIHFFSHRFDLELVKLRLAIHYLRLPCLKPHPGSSRFSKGSGCSAAIATSLASRHFSSCLWYPPSPRQTLCMLLIAISLFVWLRARASSEVFCRTNSSHCARVISSYSTNGSQPFWTYLVFGSLFHQRKISPSIFLA